MLDSAPGTPASLQMPVVPLNSPVNLRTIDSNGNTNGSETWIFSSLTSCLPRFPPKLFWGANTVNNGDSDTDEYEISLESIQVNFKHDYIGGGNQSSVFRGVLNGKNIALKKLNRASEVDIKMLKSLDHPNVIKTIGVCTKDICPCIVMEYCEQGGLYDVLQRRKVTKSLFCKWSREIAEGMTYLHSKKIIHRDLKSPNILVDKDDNTKICDFGSLYKFDKTFMPSVVMSFVGTSQYMPPEIMKNEPCNEKVDVWGFGIVLWELLTQEIPYKGITSMAIMYGVGSGSLQLHVPKEAPQTAKLLFRLCWSKKPRNRPSFASITSHLTNLQAEVAELSEDAWQMRKQVWHKEINEENQKIQNGNALEDQHIDAQELNRKRINQLKHAQDLREIYEKKIYRVDKMMRKILVFLEEIKMREDELAHRERQLSRDPAERRSGRSAPPNSVPSCKVSKQSIVRAGPRTISGRIDVENDYECRLPSVHHAVVSMPVDDDADSEVEAMGTDQSSSDEEYYGPRPRQNLSSCGSDLSRPTINRHSVGHSTPSANRSPKTNRNSIPILPSSTSDKNLQTNSEVCPSCLYQFQRNSVARISGISADSGVCTSTLTLEETGQRLFNYSESSPSTLYRNVEGRWSDGKIQGRRKPKRQGSRDSPFRGTITKKEKEKRLSSAGARLGSSGELNNRNIDLGAMRSMSMIESVEVEVTEDDQGKLVLVDSAIKPSPSYTEAINTSTVAPKNNRVVALKSEFGEPRQRDDEICINTAMLESTSTMVSSLERSLELAVGASDGLSDKESKLKAAKTHFKTHRRTASNPVPVVTETSTESDNDPVYC
ncbi:hypothetical protein FO519_001459 [Halicephalobus sp. NKZ332]|nr:hypothetical protein FO519_001459 [Halicephalobus sp. NKZ332]